MSIKVYKFEEGSWWDSRGCSCCEPIRMAYYTPIGFVVNGTPSSVSRCYLACMELEDPDLTEEDLEFYYGMDDSQLEGICLEKYGFGVNIVEEKWL